MVRVKAASIDLKVGDVGSNGDCVLKEITKAVKENVDILAFSKATFTGQTVQDFYKLGNLEKKVDEILLKVQEKTKSLELTVIVGIQRSINNILKDLAVVISKGNILGISGGFCTDFDEAENNNYILINGVSYNYSSKNLYINKKAQNTKFAVVIEEENNLSNDLIYDANLVICLGGSKRIAGKKQAHIQRITSLSKEYNVSLCYVDTTTSESTNDFVMGGLHVIAENGILLSKTENGEMYITRDIDTELIQNTKTKELSNKHLFQVNKIFFEQNYKVSNHLLREVKRHEFIPYEQLRDDAFVDEILYIQGTALANRMRKIGCKKVVLGLSGGLDSTLALIAIAESFVMQGLPLSNIHVFSMPCFATSSRTRNNSQLLAKQFCVTFKEIDISKSVEQHLKDLDISDLNRSVAFENAQARERTQLLMDYANLIGGLVIGTGDLSESALGWCTYNGDQMSMYSINAGIPKTLVRYIVKVYAERFPKVKAILNDIIDTPISPELLPGKEGEISQLTEDKIGPYNLQDFYIYNHIKYGFSPKKLYYLANIAFRGVYTSDELKKWLRVFFLRFYTSQFKREAVPDGPSVIDINLSPRDGLKLPSDLNINYLLEEIDAL